MTIQDTKEQPKKKEKKERLELHEFEALINNLRFGILGLDEQEAREKLTEWLDDYSNSKDYEIVEIRLKDWNPWH